ncbi:site-specific DNA-methyltransferase [Campylobacter upsaliensis]|uniref:site-specific DNA-methyltransferase n=1 Tax=Campylobacter upsaliensis TaxID=28080 RepID=UPI002B3B644A|nr:site-specific DNA-methyltransferase [Campylobacter upsaliensis]MEB2795460.1 site-specific DNA-methyltransferase [Campylobacter upsaliensis]
MPTKQRLTKQDITQAHIIDSTKEHNPLLDYLAKHHPQTISEERLNLDALSQALGFSPSSMQGYGLSFIGKPLANALYSTPTTKELKELDPKHSQNIIIKGDNLHALKLLKSAYDGKIKMIYIDPPYNTKNEKFIYDDNFVKEYQKLLIELDLLKLDSDGKVLEKSEVLHFLTNPSGDKAHSGWLSFMLPRLKLARDLLKDDGVIFISIDDNEQANLKILCDEIFGEENFCGQIIWLKGNAQNDADTIQTNHEYILSYAKDIQTKPINQIIRKDKVKVFKDEKTGKFYYEGAGLTMGGGDGGSLENRPNLGYTFYYNPKTKDIKPLLDYDKNAVTTTTNHEELYNDDEELIKQGYTPIRPPKMGAGNGCWKWALEKTLNELDRILIKAGKNGYSVLRKEWLNPKQVKQDDNGEFYAMVEKENPPKSFIDFVGSGRGIKELKELIGDKVFNNPKNTSLIKHLLKISTTSPSTSAGGGGGNIVLDFFAGSGTTAQAVMELNAEDGGNRQFILVQLDEPINEAKSKVAYDFCKNTLKSQNPVISDITIERVKRAAAKIAKQDLLSTKELDLDFRLFTMVQKPELVSKENDSLELITHADLSPQDKALNLALQDSKMLHKKLESIIKDKLYQCENSLYIVQMDKEVLDYIKNKTHDEIVYLNAFDDIDLQEYLNLESHLKTRLYVVFQ